QSNGYDCGVWILAQLARPCADHHLSIQLAAVLRGYQLTGIEEDNIHHFRHFLRVLVHRIADPT
ncbi:hypothetical protein SCLCIDRAFT_129648, partial [Scleroderma citrinum Foug A]